MNKELNFIVKLTTCCPGKCECCTNRQKNFKYKNDGNKIFDIEVFEKICKNVKMLGGCYICLSGGEPTIVKNIGEYIKIAKKYNLATRINSNGWNVTEENLEKWLQDGLDQIVLSIYGLNKDTIVKTRGNELLFNKSIDAINVIKKLKEKYQFIFIIQTVIMKDNYQELPELLNFAIDSKADIVWPSYLEDAINLPNIRMNRCDIDNFLNNVVPKMKSIVESRIVDKELKERLIKSIDRYYNDGIGDDYIYHKKGENCHFAGNHFTFYPNGVIDPCPGHEYFKSDYQFKINYADIDEFMTKENLEKYCGFVFDYCQYCPQGRHQEISFMPSDFNEHNSREEMR